MAGIVTTGLEKLTCTRWHKFYAHPPEAAVPSDLALYRRRRVEDVATNSQDYRHVEEDI